MAAKKKASTKPAARAASETRQADEKPEKKEEGLDGKIWVGLAALVVGLAALVWWAIPTDNQQEVVIQTEAGAFPDLPGEEAGAPLTKIERPERAIGELAIITSKSDEDIRAIATTEAIAKHLAARHCGSACDVVKKVLTDEDNYALDIRTTEDIVLPPKDTFDTVAIGLTPAERDSVAEKKNAAFIHIEGNVTPEQPAARALMSVGAALAEMLDGFVYDDSLRRIFSKDEMLAQAITVPVGDPVFKPQQIAIQLYRQEDGSERLISLGMQRFGAPDIALRGANMAAGPMLSNLINAVASAIVAGHNDAPVRITLDEIAKVIGKQPADLNPNPTAARPVRVDAIKPEPVDGDPDNDIIELTPFHGSTRENWDAILSLLFGAPSTVDAPANDKELTAAATKARGTLADAIKRFQAGEGLLYLEGPFPIPPEAKPDGGAGIQDLWIEAASCDAKLCSGIFANEPTSGAGNIAPGKTVSVNQAEALDWMLQERDGGTAGGESIKVLRARAKK